MGKINLFNCDPFNFGKKIGKICLVVIEFLGQIIRKDYLIGSSLVCINSL